jgi:hypothetical protein
MATTYTPGLLSQTLLGSKTEKLDTTVDDLFKNSAGPSQVATALLPVATSAKAAKVDPAQRAREAVKTAKSVNEIITQTKKDKKVS